ncbi:hypothetical protein N7494_010753 [Penicillium frequentans]|uniref:Kinesin light chain n=1 Tax=Penicillium frequentans TaxID=3151616 RepID=A0AAD6G910_9EURO|nr:hypothetical protein N7494_010753 [Penicillium glabrum]
MLAFAYQKLGRLEEFMQLQVQVMETRKLKFGEDDLPTLKSMGDLARLYQHQGQWEEAEQLQLQVIEASRNKSGEDHPDTMMCLVWLASGNFQAAMLKPSI